MPCGGYDDVGVINGLKVYFMRGTTSFQQLRDITMDKNMEKKTAPSDNEKVRKSMSGATVGGGSEQNLHIDPQEEKKLLFKLDIHIAPIVMILYLIAFLDRFSDSFTTMY